MKIQQERNRGFVLIMVIAFITMIAGAMALMSTGAKNMAFETDRRYLSCCRDNLTTSALAWAKHNQARLTADENIELDTSLIAPRSELQITPTGRAAVQVTLSCRKNRQKTHSVENYHLGD